jgi:hypothetical protein
MGRAPEPSGQAGAGDVICIIVVGAAQWLTTRWMRPLSDAPVPTSVSESRSALRRTHIQLVAIGSPGQVMEITATGASRQFVVGVYSQELGTVTKAPLRTFRLREIAPGSGAPSAPAAAHRRARPLPPG